MFKFLIAFRSCSAVVYAIKDRKYQTVAIIYKFV